MIIIPQVGRDLDLRKKYGILLSWVHGMLSSCMSSSDESHPWWAPVASRRASRRHPTTTTYPRTFFCCHIDPHHVCDWLSITDRSIDRSLQPEMGHALKIVFHMYACVTRFKNPKSEIQPPAAVRQYCMCVAGSVSRTNEPEPVYRNTTNWSHSNSNCKQFSPQKPAKCSILLLYHLRWRVIRRIILPWLRIWYLAVICSYRHLLPDDTTPPSLPPPTLPPQSPPTTTTKITTIGNTIQYNTPYKTIHTSIRGIFTAPASKQESKNRPKSIHVYFFCILIVFVCTRGEPFKHPTRRC